MRINFGWSILGDNMVALSGNGFYHNDTTTQSVGRKGEFAPSDGAANRGASESSVASVAENYFNGGLTGNIPNGTTDYIWQGWQCMEERNPFGGSGSTDTPIRQYIWGTYIDECIQLNTLTPLGPQSLPACTYYLLQDLLYRAVALTNSSGNIVEAYDTDAYAQTIIYTGPGTDDIWFTDDDVQSSYGANEIVYCGYRFDPETELYYLPNRTYNAALGRWIQRDPIGYGAGPNLLQFVDGSPVGFIDPTGLAGAIPFSYISQNAWAQVADNIEESLLARSFGTHVHGWTHLGAAEYVPLVLRLKGAAHQIEVGAAKGVFKVAIKLGTLLAADNPVGWLVCYFGFCGKRGIESAIKIFEHELSAMRAKGANEIYRAFWQKKLCNGWNNASIYIDYSPFTGVFEGAIMGSVGQLNMQGEPNGQGRIRPFFYPFAGRLTLTSGHKVTSFLY